MMDASADAKVARAVAAPVDLTARTAIVRIRVSRENLLLSISSWTLF
jgi:tRNA(Ser,Leu) C12 N-acetylase TAN1